jgi:hypothetical protein
MHCHEDVVQVALAGIVVVMVGLNAHILVLFTLTQTPDGANGTTLACDWSDYNSPLAHYDFHVFPWIDVCVTSLVPSTLLVVGNGLLAATVSRSARAAKTMTRQSNSSAAREKAASSLTLTLMAVSTSYLLFTLPVCVAAVWLSYVKNDGVTDPDVIALVWTVTNLVWYCNASVNFYIYVLTGTKFRHHCLWLLCCRGRLRDVAPPAGSRATSGVSSTALSMSAMPVTSQAAGQHGTDTPDHTTHDDHDDQKGEEDL